MLGWELPEGPARPSIPPPHSFPGLPQNSAQDGLFVFSSKGQPAACKLHKAVTGAHPCSCRAGSLSDRGFNTTLARAAHDEPHVRGDPGAPRAMCLREEQLSFPRKLSRRSSNTHGLSSSSISKAGGEASSWAGGRQRCQHRKQRTHFWRLTVCLRCARVRIVGAAPRDCGDQLSVLTMSGDKGRNGEGSLPGGATTPGPREQGSPDPGASPLQRRTHQADCAVRSGHGTSGSVTQEAQCPGRLALTLPGCVSSGKF